MTKNLRNSRTAILATLTAAASSLAAAAVPSVEDIAKLPLAFEQNVGQADSRVAFLAHGLDYSVFLTRQEAVLALGRADGRMDVLRMGLAGANPAPALSGLEPLPGQSNYLVGDRTKWHIGVASFARVRYSSVYPGVDLLYYGNRGQLEYDFEVAPGADPSRIRLRLGGASKLRLAANGDLVLEAGAEEIRLRKPVVYQNSGRGGRVEVAGEFVLRGSDEAGFRLGTYDPSQPLVIDPAIVRSTFLGGKGKDIGYSIAVDAKGFVYVAGGTTSAAGFPLVACLDCALSGPSDAFVTKFAPAGGSFVYSTYLGGSGSDVAYGIATDGRGDAYITGETNSPNFPVTDAGAVGYGGGQDAFVTALNPTGGLIYSTYLGGSGTDVGRGIAVDGSGNAFVTGSTNSPNFPVLHCLFCGPLGGTDAFVAGLTPTGALTFSSYFGGTGNDIGYAIAIDANDQFSITGSTSSLNLPVVSCIQCVNGGGLDAFASSFIFSPPTLALKWSTYWGGSKNEAGFGISMDNIGELWITGYTDSDNFPVSRNCVQCVNKGAQDAIVVRFNYNAIGFSDYLGGAGTDTGRSIVEVNAQTAYLTGDTTSNNFPLVSCIAGIGCALNGLDDAFVAEYTLAGGPILAFSTYLGGKGNDAGRGIALGPQGEYVTGSTASNTFPIVGPCTQCVYKGGVSDAFVTVIH